MILGRWHFRGIRKNVSGSLFNQCPKHAPTQLGSMECSKLSRRVPGQIWGTSSYLKVLKV